MTLQSLKTRTGNGRERPLRAVGEPAGMPAHHGTDPVSPEHIERRTVDGLGWTFRGHFGRTLESVPAAAWSDPAGHRCVEFALLEGLFFEIPFDQAILLWGKTDINNDGIISYHIG